MIFFIIVQPLFALFPLTCQLTCNTCANKETDRSNCQTCNPLLKLNDRKECVLNASSKAIILTYLTDPFYTEDSAANWTLNGTAIDPTSLPINLKQCSGTNLIGMFTQYDTIRVSWSLPPHNLIYIKFLLVSIIQPFNLKIYAESKLVHTVKLNGFIPQPNTLKQDLCNLNKISQINRYVQFNFSHFGNTVNLTFDGQFVIDNANLAQYPPNQGDIVFSLRDFLLIVNKCDICPDTEIQSTVLLVMIVAGLVFVLVVLAFVTVSITNYINYSYGQPFRKNIAKFEKIKARFQTTRKRRRRSKSRSNNKSRLSSSFAHQSESKSKQEY